MDLWYTDCSKEVFLGIGIGLVIRGCVGVIFDLPTFGNINIARI